MTGKITKATMPTVSQMPILPLLRYSERQFRPIIGINTRMATTRKILSENLATAIPWGGCDSQSKQS
ncbi:hypothetical protein ACFLUP_02320 [Chloroflexota bacterium]